MVVLQRISLRGPDLATMVSIYVERNLTVDLSVACSLPALGGSLSMSPARYRS